MNTAKKQRNFSMKYCPELEDHVVVMMTSQEENQTQFCLSSHLCPTERKSSCGNEILKSSNKSGFSDENSLKTEKKYFL